MLPRDMTSHFRVNICQLLRGKCCSTNCEYGDNKYTETLVNTKLHVVTSQNKAVSIFSIVRISNLTM